MSIDDTIKKEEVIKAILKVHKIRNKHVSDNDSLGHKIWQMANYTGAYMMEEFGIDYKEVEECNTRQLDLDLGISDSPELVYEGDRITYIPAGYPTKFYRKPKK